MFANLARKELLKPKKAIRSLTYGTLNDKVS